MAEQQNQETKVEIEREYSIPLRSKVRIASRFKKTPKAVKTVKEFLARHMRIRDRDLKKVKIDTYLNEFLWGRSIRNPPHKVKVKAKKYSDGIVRVELLEYPEKLRYKKMRFDKQFKEAQEASKKQQESQQTSTGEQTQPSQPQKQEQSSQPETQKQTNDSKTDSGESQEKADEKQSSDNKEDSEFKTKTEKEKSSEEKPEKKETTTKKTAKKSTTKKTATKKASSKKPSNKN